jgi:hypothetical protein
LCSDRVRNTRFKCYQDGTSVNSEGLWDRNSSELLQSEDVKMYVLDLYYVSL